MYYALKRLYIRDYKLFIVKMVSVVTKITDMDCSDCVFVNADFVAFTLDRVVPPKKVPLKCAVNPTAPSAEACRQFEAKPVKRAKKIKYVMNHDGTVASAGFKSLGFTPKDEDHLDSIWCVKHRMGGGAAVGYYVPLDDPEMWPKLKPLSFFSRCKALKAKGVTTLYIDLRA